MTNEPFLRPRLTGPRFEGHAIPLELLSDLAVLEEMVIEVAKWLYLKENQSRKRTPRGFTDDIGLNLTAVEEGSAVPVINLVIASSLLFPSQSPEYFEKARDCIISAIDAADQNKSISEYLPDRVLGYFDRFGRSLRDGEGIEFTLPSSTRTARLTKEVRRKLILKSFNVKELTEEVTVHGLVHEADQSAMTFQVQLIDNRKIPAPMAIQHWDTILEAFAGYKQGVRVRLQGIGRVDRRDRLLKIESVEHISILDPLDVPARMDELKLLKDGWLDGKGVAPVSAQIDWFADAFSTRYPEDLQLPHVYPTGDGNVQLEWSLKSHEASLEVNLDKHEAYWHALNLATNDEADMQLQLDDENDWLRLIETLQKLG
ncbi:MAG: hypothetical protein EXS05_17120 [Planctomycetaceae bacterium]|nr:hypothetical protein [Planctomycetaceae bacterium]